MKKLLLLASLAVTGLLAATVPALAAAAPALAATSAPNFGYYDNQTIEYEATAEVTASPQQAQVLAAGNIVFHIVDASGSVPAVQLARAQAAFPNDAGAGNVLNFIPTDSPRSQPARARSRSPRPSSAARSSTSPPSAS